MLKGLRLINTVRKDEGGAALVEYGLLIGLITMVSVVAVTQLGLAASGKLNTVCASLGGAHC
jgi:Flp pilus assembly pilin Flp